MPLESLVHFSSSNEDTVEESGGTIQEEPQPEPCIMNEYDDLTEKRNDVVLVQDGVTTYCDRQRFLKYNDLLKSNFRRYFEIETGQDLFFHFCREMNNVTANQDVLLLLLGLAFCKSQM